MRTRSWRGPYRSSRRACAAGSGCWWRWAPTGSPPSWPRSSAGQTACASRTWPTSARTRRGSSRSGATSWPAARTTRPRAPSASRFWAGRSAAELVECQRHEALLNLAFATTPDFHPLCPYGFDAHGLPCLREVVAAHATLAGLTHQRARDLAFAVNEVTTNSVRHAGGRGVLRLWTEDRFVVCDVRDAGRIDEPLAGRVRPSPERGGGWGLWLANQLCELVQVRCFENGSAVRVRMERP